MYEAYSEYRGDITPDPLVLKKLRLRVEAEDHSQFPPVKKLKICGMDLEELPPEVFHLFELEVRHRPHRHNTRSIDAGYNAGDVLTYSVDPEGL